MTNQLKCDSRSCIGITHCVERSAVTSTSPPADCGMAVAALADEDIARASLVELRRIRVGQDHLIGFLSGMADALSRNPFLGLRKLGGK